MSITNIFQFWLIMILYFSVDRSDPPPLTPTPTPVPTAKLPHPIFLGLSIPQSCCFYRSLFLRVTEHHLKDSNIPYKSDNTQDNRENRTVFYTARNNEMPPCLSVDSVDTIYHISYCTNSYDVLSLKLTPPTPSHFWPKRSWPAPEFPFRSIQPFGNG